MVEEKKKTRRDYGFAAWLERGESKEAIMQHFCMTEEQFEKAKADVERIKKGRKIEKDIS